MSLILASQSPARKNMLLEKGIDFQCIPADLNEEEIIDDLIVKGARTQDIPLELAKAKSLKISKENSESYIIGSDQILIIDQKIYSKVKTKDEAMERLLTMQGRSHNLVCGIAVAKNKKIIWGKMDSATLTMRPMSEVEIEDYIRKAESDVYNCVGCYALEGLGKTLFEKVEGDFYTILGMPLTLLLEFLKGEGEII